MAIVSILKNLKNEQIVYIYSLSLLYRDDIAFSINYRKRYY